MKTDLFKAATGRRPTSEELRAAANFATAIADAMRQLGVPYRRAFEIAGPKGLGAWRVVSYLINDALRGPASSATNLRTAAKALDHEARLWDSRHLDLEALNV